MNIKVQNKKLIMKYFLKIIYLNNNYPLNNLSLEEFIDSFYEWLYLNVNVRIFFYQRKYDDDNDRFKNERNK